MMVRKLVSKRVSLKKQESKRPVISVSPSSSMKRKKTYRKGN
jgi:hypothetical protein